MIRVPRQIDAKGENSRPINDVQSQLVALIDTLNQTPIINGRIDIDQIVALIGQFAQLSAQVAQLAEVPIVKGRQTELFNLAAGVSQNLPHGLGRTYLGWIIARVSYSGASAAVVQEASGNPDPALYVRLNCSQPVSLVLWVY